MKIIKSLSTVSASATMSDSEDNTASVSVIAIKVPEFSHSSAVGWFSILEAQFHLKNITTSSTKFYNALAALPADFVSDTPSEILNAADYDQLIKHVLDTFEETKPELFEQLYQKTTLSGRPSQDLRSLQALAKKAGISNCKDLIRNKFISILPPNIAPAVATQTSVSLTELGTLADELMPLHNKLCNVAISSSTDKPYTRDNRTRNDSAPSQPAQHIGLRPFSPNQRQKICRAHIFYAERARTCKPWCRFPNKQGCRMAPSSRPASRSSSPTPPSENSNSGSY